MVLHKSLLSGRRARIGQLYWHKLAPVGSLKLQSHFRRHRNCIGAGSGHEGQPKMAALWDDEVPPRRTPRRRVDLAQEVGVEAAVPRAALLRIRRGAKHALDTPLLRIPAFQHAAANRPTPARPCPGWPTARAESHRLNTLIHKRLHKSWHDRWLHMWNVVYLLGSVFRLALLLVDVIILHLPFHVA